MIRHALAPIHPPAARALGIPRTLDELGGLSAAGGPQATGGAVALTFDDGPHPQGTPAILDVLDRHRARATFFVIGEQVQRHPGLLTETLARGHAVALHGFRHRWQTRLTAGVLRDDVNRGIAAIAEVTGQPPALHRPPYGIYAPAGLRIVRDAGLRPLLWSRWGKDWRRLTTPDRIAARVLGAGVRAPGIAAHGAVRGGDVVLLHDADYYSAQGSHIRTAAALERIATELELRGFGTVLCV